MTWEQDVKASFNGLLKYFGVPVAHGSDAGLAMFTEPTESILGDGQYSDEYAIEFSQDTFPAIKSGEFITVNGIQFKVRSVTKIEDGFTHKATLQA